MRLLLPVLSEIGVVSLIVALFLGSQVAFCMLLWIGRELSVRWSKLLCLLRNEVARLNTVEEGSLLTDAPLPATLESTRRHPIGRFLRSARFVLTTSLILTISALAAIQFVFFDDAIRMALARAEDKSGVVFDFDDASGNLLTGCASFKNLRIRRDVHPACIFDVTVRDTSLNIDLLRLFTGSLSFSDVRLTGVAGNYRRTAAPIDKPPRWPFEVERFDMSEVSMLISDESREPALVNLPLIITQSTATSLRSNWAANDVLFHTNANGTFNGEPLELRCTKGDSHYRFAWNAPQMSVGLLSSFFGEFWNMFETGDATVHVEGVSRPDSIVMDVSIEADGLKLSQKTLSGPESNKVDAVVRKCVEHDDGKLELALSVTVDKRTMLGELAPEAAPLWAMLANAVNDKQADACGITPDSLRESGRRARRASSAFQTSQKSDFRQ